MPLVSIIVPMYKVEKYIHKCIQSIINQTYKDIELILVDDGSPDRCGSIGEEYASKDFRIKVKHKENEGLSSARNAGLDLAMGKYVVFIDSDDWIESEMIQSMLGLAEKNNGDLVICNYRKVNTEGGVMHDKCLNIKTQIIEINNLTLEKYFDMYIIPNNHSFEVWNKMYRLDIIKKNNLRFHRNNEIFAEDKLFNFSFYCHTNIVCVTDMVFYNYLQRQDSIIHSVRPTTLQELNLLKRFWNHAKDNDLLHKLNGIIPELFYTLLKDTISDLYNKENKNVNVIRSQIKELISLPEFLICMKILSYGSRYGLRLKNRGASLKGRFILRLIPLMYWLKLYKIALYMNIYLLRLEKS